MLQNKSFVVKIGFDTPENGPIEVWAANSQLPTPTPLGSKQTSMKNSPSSAQKRSTRSTASSTAARVTVDRPDHATRLDTARRATVETSSPS